MDRPPTQFTRAGLDYELWDGETLYHFEPACPFYVNGVYYDAVARCRNHTRLMVELVDDDRAIWHDDAARMDHSDPPGDAELDTWMHWPYTMPYLHPRERTPR